MIYTESVTGNNGNISGNVWGGEELLASAEKGEPHPEDHYTTKTLVGVLDYTDRRIRQMCKTGQIKAKVCSKR